MFSSVNNAYLEIILLLKLQTKKKKKETINNTSVLNLDRDSQHEI